VYLFFESVYVYSFSIPKEEAKDVEI